MSFNALSSQFLSISVNKLLDNYRFDQIQTEKNPNLKLTVGDLNHTSQQCDLSFILFSFHRFPFRHPLLPTSLSVPWLCHPSQWE